MNKIIRIDKYSLLIDIDEASQKLSKDCLSGRQKYELTGVCDFSDRILLVLEEVEATEVHEYRFDLFNSTNIESVIGEIDNRYFADFLLISGFRIDDRMCGLFKKVDKT